LIGALAKEGKRANLNGERGDGESLCKWKKKRGNKHRETEHPPQRVLETEKKKEDRRPKVGEVVQKPAHTREGKGRESELGKAHTS